MGKGPYGDIPEENMVFNYNSSHNISFKGCHDTEITIDEWNSMDYEAQREMVEEIFWSLDLVDFWVSEDAEVE